MSKYTDYLDVTQGYHDILNKRDGVSFHQHILDTEIKNKPGKPGSGMPFDVTNKQPGVYQKNIDNAKERGLAKAEKFLNDVDDVKSPRHAKSFDRFANDFRHDRQLTRHFFVANELNNAQDFELQDQAYESQVFNVYSMATNTEQDGFYVNRFREALRLKWSAVGYKNDAGFAKMFFDLHPLSGGVPNNPRLKD